MPSKQKYEEAIAAATADDNPEAVAELTRRMNAEHPPKTANAGEGRKARRMAQRDSRKEPEQAPVEVIEAPEEKFNEAIEKALADGNEEAAAELRLMRAIGRAKADDNAEAVAELTARLQGPAPEDKSPTATTRRQVEQGRELRMDDDAVIQQFEESYAVDPEALRGTAEERRYREALERKQERYQAESAEAAKGIISRGDAAAGGMVNFFENFLGMGDEIYGVSSATGSAVYDIFNSDKSAGEIWDDFTGRVPEAMAEGRERKQQFEDANPGLNVASDALGFGAQLAGSAKIFGALPLAGSMSGRIAQGGGIAGAEGAALGFLEGDTLDNRMWGAALGGVLGGGLGLGVGGALEGVVRYRKAKADNFGDTAADQYVLNREAAAQERSDAFIAEGQNKTDEAAQRNVERQYEAIDKADEQAAARREELLESDPEAVEWADKEYGKPYESGGILGLMDIRKSPKVVTSQTPETRKWTTEALRAAEDYAYLSKLDNDALEAVVIAEMADAMRLKGYGITAADVDLPTAPFITDVFDRVKPRMKGKTTEQLDQIAGRSSSRGLAANALDASDAKRGVGAAVAAGIKPITAMWKNEVGAGIAGSLERALLRALPKKQAFDNMVSTRMMPIIRSMSNDPEKLAKTHLLNAMNTSLTAAQRQMHRNRFVNRIAELTGREPLQIDYALREYIRERGEIVNGYNRLIGNDILRKDIMHTQKLPKSTRTVGAVFKTRAPRGKVGADEALKEQTRPVLTPKTVDEYADPFVTDNRWLKERLQDGEITEVFGLRPAQADELEEAAEGALIPKRLKEVVYRQGGRSAEVQGNVDDLIQTTLYDSLEGVGPLLRMLRSTNIMMGLANPKSAVLNLSEPMIMAMENDFNSIFRAYASRDGMPFTAEELGLAQVMTGDELKRIAAATAGRDGLVKSAEFFDQLAEVSMKGSGFEASALGAQNVQMKAAINEATNIVRRGIKKGVITKEALAEFDSKYGQWFSKAEQSRLMRVLQRMDASGAKKGQKVFLSQEDQTLMRDFQLATLNDWQPLTAMGRSYINNAYPMVRPFLLFTTYTTRMHEAISRKAVQHIAKSRELRDAGKTGAANKELAKAVYSYMGRLMYSQALWAVTNQTRQLMMGRGLKELMDIQGEITGIYNIDSNKEADEWDDFDAEGLVEDFIYGIFSQATGGILPANKLGYKRGTKAMEEAEGIGDAAKALGLYGYDAIAETMVPTFILGETLKKSEQRDSYQPLIERLPIVGPTIFKTQRKYGEKD